MVQCNRPEPIAGHADHQPQPQATIAWIVPQECPVADGLRGQRCLTLWTHTTSSVAERCNLPDDPTYDRCSALSPLLLCWVSASITSVSLLHGEGQTVGGLEAWEKCYNIQRGLLRSRALRSWWTTAR